MRAPNEQDCDKEIDGSVLCYAGRACFVLQARVSAGVGDFTLPTQMTGSSLIVPRLIKKPGAGNHVVRRHACSQELAPLPSDLI